APMIDIPHNENPELNDLLGKAVVLDVSSPFVYAGTLVADELHYLVLAEADVHDLRDTNTTREMYVNEIKRHGIHWNRKRVWVRKNEIVSISAVDDIFA